MGLTFSRIIRRSHLFSAVFLWPWFLMYAVSALVFNYPAPKDTGWKLLFQQEYDHTVKRNSPIEQTALLILGDFNIQGPFQARRAKGNVLITVYRFSSDIRITYLLRERRIVAEERKLNWRDALIRMHARGGFEHSPFANDLWAVMVDIHACAVLYWVFSGLFMWCQNSQLRTSGTIVLLFSVLTFLSFLFLL